MDCLRCRVSRSLGLWGDVMTRAASILAAITFALIMGHTITKAMANVIAYEIEREAQ